MLRAVIDTSSLVSYVLTSGELMQRVVAAWREDRFTALSSPATRDELAAVLTRPAIRRLSAGPLDPLIQGFESFTLYVPGALELHGASRDAKDDKFLACAVEGEAGYLVSGDRDLREMRRCRDVAIVNPGQFLVALELYEMTSEAMANRFGREMLNRIELTIPLEPATAARLAQALRT